MDESQRMAIYSESRLEDMHNAAESVRLFGPKPYSWTRFVVVTTALLLGMLVWWIW